MEVRENSVQKVKVNITVEFPLKFSRGRFHFFSFSLLIAVVHKACSYMRAVKQCDDKVLRVKVTWREECDGGGEGGGVIERRKRRRR